LELELRIYGAVFRVQGLALMVEGAECRVQGPGRIV